MLKDPALHLRSDSAFVSQRAKRAFKGRDALGGNEGKPSGKSERGRYEAKTGEKKKTEQDGGRPWWRETDERR